MRDLDVQHGAVTLLDVHHRSATRRPKSFHLQPMIGALLQWYVSSARDLPWRRTSDPYAIWVSEIMLQQTRVADVIPYYQRFLKRLPHVQDLAPASEIELLSLWAGLGYYSRARNMQKAARQIVDAGGFPRDYESIRGLAGVGDY